MVFPTYDSWTTDGKSVRSKDGVIATCATSIGARLMASAPDLLVLAQFILDEYQSEREELHLCATVGGVDETADDEDQAIILEMDAIIVRAKRIIGRATGENLPESTKGEDA